MDSSFNSWSFFSGALTGFVIRATDIVPMLGGLLLGLSIRSLPDLIQLQHFPEVLQLYLQKLGQNLSFAEKPNSQKIDPAK